MIKSFEQFNKICESTQKKMYFSGDEYVDFVDLYCSLDHDCAMYCLNLVKNNGGEIEFEKPETIDIWDLNKNKYRTIYVKLLFVGKQDPKEINGECGAYYDYESGEYLIIKTTDGEEIIVDSDILEGHYLLHLYQILDEICD